MRFDCDRKCQTCFPVGSIRRARENRAWERYEESAEVDGGNNVGCPDFYDDDYTIDRPCWNPKTFFEFMAAVNRDDYVNACGCSYHWDD